MREEKKNLIAGADECTPFIKMQKSSNKNDHNVYWQFNYY